MKTKKEVLPAWDLRELFAGSEDPRIEKSLKKSFLCAKKLKAKFKGRISVLRPEEIREMLREYERILTQLSKAETYAYMVFSADTSFAAGGALLRKVEHDVSLVSAELFFVELELGILGADKLDLLASRKELRNYAHYLRFLAKESKHHLSEAEEVIISRKNLSGKNAFARLFDEELAGERYEVILEGRKKELGQEEILGLLYTAKDRAARKAAAEAFSKGLKKKEKTLAFIFNTLIADKKAEDDLRKFSFPEESRHLSNELLRKEVEAMAKAAEGGYPLVKKYYTLKKKILGVSKLYDFDRYAPLPHADGKKYSFVEARRIVKESLEEFSPKLAAMAEELFQKKHVDASVRKGKRSGAYCMYVSPETDPFVLINFKGSANDVLTLAHEMGHAIHGKLASKQNYLNYRSILPLAETASIFAEGLVFAKLAREAKDPREELSLYMRHIESIFASVQRQVAMYRFEQDVHGAFAQKGELAAKQLEELWLSRQKEMFQGSVELGKGYASWWAYVSHFYQTPFYVYAYAFGELLTLSLLARYNEQGSSFAEKFEEILSAGSSMTPHEILARAGVDMGLNCFWEKGISLIAEQIDHAERLARGIFTKKN